MPELTTVTIRHNFEAGHRLPPLGGKCQNLHGHSWWADVTVTGPLIDPGVVVEFATLKRLVRDWIDEHLDHGMILGHDDELRPVLERFGKVYDFPGWPTVEAVARHLAERTQGLINGSGMGANGVRVVQVRVTETNVNAATYRVTP